MRDTHDPGSGPTRPPDSSTDALAVLQRLGGELADLVEALAPERVPGHQVRQITVALTAIERAARGMRLVLRKAAADTGDWRAKGHTSPADQVAKEEGISLGQAKAEIDASAGLAHLPTARDAARRGEISPEAAAVVAAGAAADPTAENGLVRSARRGDLRATRRRAQDVIARADERSGERARRIHQRRSLRTWVSLDGAGHGIWTIPAESHARLLAALEPYRRAAYRAARASGERLTDEQLMADALDMLARDTVLDHDDLRPDHHDPAPGTGVPAADSPSTPPSDTTESPASGSGALFDADDPTASGRAHPDPTPPAATTADPDPSPGPAARSAPHHAPTTRGAAATSAPDWPAADPAAPLGAPVTTGRDGPVEGDGTSRGGERSGRSRGAGPPPGTGHRPADRAQRPLDTADAAGGDPQIAMPRSPLAGAAPPARAPAPARPPAPSPSARAAPVRRRRAPTQVHVIVDFDALRRGHATTGETCEIHGIGAVPVSLVEHLMGDALLRLVVTGTDITKVSSQRRYVPEALRRALFARDKGRCVVCGADRHLELHHHRIDFAEGGPTAHDNLAHLCTRHHALATHCGFTLHRTDDGWRLDPPDHAGGRRGPP